MKHICISFKFMWWVLVWFENLWNSVLWWDQWFFKCLTSCHYSRSVQLIRVDLIPSFLIPSGLNSLKFTAQYITISRSQNKTSTGDTLMKKKGNELLAPDRLHWFCSLWFPFPVDYYSPFESDSPIVIMCHASSCQLLPLPATCLQ